MSTPTRRSFIGALAAALACACPQARAQPATKVPQFIYVLRVASRFHEAASWTEKENAVLGLHFNRLRKATESGQVILAGRSTEPLDKTFGVVIFEAANEEAARLFMNSDPAVEAGIMTATLHPYDVALLRKP